MTLPKILTTTLLPCALLVAPAFAQSSATNAKDYAKDKVTTEAKDAVKDMAADKAPDMGAPNGGMMIKGDPLTIETPSAVIIAEDAEMTMDGDVTTIEADDITHMSKDESPAMMEAPAAVTAVTIACPEGTTAQNDGTCMITGDYQE